MDKFKVLIVENQTMPRKLFEQYISLSKCFEVEQTFEDADNAVIYCMRNKPDLILMDVMTKGGCNGLVAAEKIKKSNADIKIIIVTSMPEISWIERAKEIGVDSFWYKDVSEEPIISLMEKTMGGEHVYPDSTPKVVFGNIDSSQLTDREQDVLRQMVVGATNQEIADKLFISVPAVKKHIQSMLDKTGFKNRTELAVMARGIGLIIVNEE